VKTLTSALVSVFTLVASVSVSPTAKAAKLPKSFSLSCFNDQTSAQTSEIRISQDLKETTAEKVAILAYVDVQPANLDEAAPVRSQEMIGFVTPAEFNTLQRNGTGTVVLENYQTVKQAGESVFKNAMMLKVKGTQAELAVDGYVVKFGCRK
jgi:hypothetical protein